MKSLFCFSEAIAPFGQTIHPISTSPPLAQINVCLTQVLLAARWEAPKEQFKNITSILFGHRGGKNHKKKSFNPGSRVCPDVRMEAWTLTSLVGWRSKSHPPKKFPKTAAVQIAHRFLICPWVQWMSLVSVPPRQHTSVHTVYCTTLGNDPWLDKEREEAVSLLRCSKTWFVCGSGSNPLTCSQFGKCAWVGICSLHRALWSSVK